ncbi:MAG: hypothetical protein IT381_04710 [Deltaproteobacteria bacterium]|nr:hypothetical protein [Deltaproteobacteria bacterium]
MSARFFAGTEDGHVVCFDAQAKTQWILRVGKGAVTSLYASARGTLVATTSEGVLARIADKGDKGQLLTRKTNEGRAYVACVEAGAFVIAATGDGLIAYAEAESLQTLSDVDEGGIPLTSLALKDDALFYASADGTLHKRSAQDPRGKGARFEATEQDSEITALVVRGDRVFALLSSGAIDAFSAGDIDAAPERAFDDALRICGDSCGNVLAIDGEGAVWRVNQGLGSSQAGRIELEDMIVAPVEVGGILATCQQDGMAALWKLGAGSLTKLGAVSLKVPVACVAAIPIKK